MATEAANAERQARAQNTINGHVERISRSIGVAAPPPVSKADGRPAQQANEAERMATFLELVANHVDPSNAGKSYAAAAASGGIGEYNHTEEQQKAQKRSAGDEGDEEPTFRGRKLSEFDAIPDDALTNEEGIGEATAADIVKARHKRDRSRR